MKFLHVADVHLDSPLRGLERYEGAPVAELRGASRRAFSNLIDLALAEGVDLVLIAGDLYDGDWRDYNTGLFFTQQTARLREAGIRCFVIAGNHDAASQLTRRLRPPDHVTFLATRRAESHRLEDLGVALHGQGFANRAVTEDLTLGYPAADPGLFNIGLLHTSLDGRPGHAPYAPCSRERLAAQGYDYWALGHVHAREVVSTAPWVVFPGNLQGRHVREAGAKGCTLVQVVDGRVTQADHCPLDVARWAICRIPLQETASPAEIQDRLLPALQAQADAADGRLLAVRIQLDGPGALDRRLQAQRERLLNDCRALAAEVDGGDIWIEQLQIATDSAAARAATPPSADAAGGLAVRGLVETIAGFAADPAQLAALADEVGDLADKLPAALRLGEEPFDPRDPALLRRLLTEVKPLLLERLLGDGDAGEGP